jgi:hypothetical protein
VHNVDTSKISIESKSKEYFYRWSRNETVDDKNGTISLTITNMILIELRLLPSNTQFQVLKGNKIAKN